MRPGGFAKPSPVPLPISTIRIPVHMIETLNKVMQCNNYKELGHEPTPEEVANEMGTALVRVGIMKMAQQPISLQSPVGDGVIFRFR